MAITKEIKIPEGVSIDINDALCVTGPKGTIKKPIKMAGIEIKQSGDICTISTQFTRREYKAMVGTISSLLKNMIYGVTHTYTYHLKAVFAHFPMTITCEGNRLVIKNFLGEKAERSVDLPPDVNVQVKGQDIYVSGLDNQVVGLAAGKIMRLTKVKNRDRRVFQDGIYLVEKEKCQL